MVTYLTPDMETQKHRSESATLYIDYPTGVYDVRPEFHNNRPELEKLDSLMRPLTEGNLANISSISICGYASPDGLSLIHIFLFLPPDNIRLPNVR